MDDPMQETAPVASLEGRSRPLTLHVQDADEPATDFDRWVRLYAESVARAEGLLDTPHAAAA